jgi:hypothetical protein
MLLTVLHCNELACYTGPQVFLSSGKWTFDLELEMAIVCRADSMKTVARKLVEYTLDLVGV